MTDEPAAAELETDREIAERVFVPFGSPHEQLIQAAAAGREAGERAGAENWKQMVVNIYRAGGSDAVVEQIHHWQKRSLAARKEGA